MRSSVFILAVVLAGCGKSFQEADAIYKDEVQTLKAIESEYAHKKADAISKLRSDISHKFSVAANTRQEATQSTWDEIMKPKMNEAFKTLGVNAEVAESRFDLWLSVAMRRAASAEDDNDPSTWIEAPDIRADHILLGESCDPNGKILAKLRNLMDKALPLPSRTPTEEQIANTVKPIDDHYAPLIAAQEEKVKAAYEAKEAAK